MKTIKKTGSAVALVLLLLSASAAPSAAQAPRSAGLPAASATAQQNRQVVNRFYEAVESQQFAVIKDVFLPNARQLIPYAPPGFPKRLEGSEAIYQQFSGLTAYFGRMRFPRQIFVTEDPDFLFVKFNGDMEVKSGGKYENEYVGTFRLKDGKIVEYVEYFNPLVMARAFNIKL
ncbi:nuclear transport factor 2 family protein [Hymenobacter guriensis]|uniref:Nuclear transport factor 2 family protein n=1 Tax=Hymenobacter guriensis TaxID=2793065 RepID=A0ABS0L4R8_9BACT|nr:nuclear transport factor 2 family protein [Hymenobacter guriensis]MBG8554372.1 nuclear transport factor 2 family protein [Hymenobacter guriensis]